MNVYYVLDLDIESIRQASVPPLKQTNKQCLRFIFNLPIISIGASLKSVVFESYVCLEYILVFQGIVVLVLFMSQKKILLLCNDDKAPSTYSDY